MNEEQLQKPIEQNAIIIELLKNAVDNHNKLNTTQKKLYDTLVQDSISQFKDK